VLAATAVRFFTTGLFQLTASGTWEDIAGVVGLVLCAQAVYAAAAMAIEDARGETVLPILRRGAGREIAREAGVRQQL
jgi:succinate-acetate transporter protein